MDNIYIFVKFPKSSFKLCFYIDNIYIFVKFPKSSYRF